jgi:4-diphosphocytidyl-2-C-methyl-D-erythritol kinase
VTARVPAKVNLQLSVGPPGDDGYHELVTVFHAVSLFDEVTVRAAERTTVTVTGEGGSTVPLGPANLAVQAATALARAIGRHGRGAAGVRIDIRKRIPVAAGLAGGSADAAAALVACNELWQAGASQRELREIGAQIGSDVPFALIGGTAVGQGRGERLTRALVSGSYHWVLAFAAGGLATPDVYATCDRLRAARGAAGGAASGTVPGRASGAADTGSTQASAGPAGRSTAGRGGIGSSTAGRSGIGSGGAGGTAGSGGAGGTAGRGGAGRGGAGRGGAGRGGAGGTAGRGGAGNSTPRRASADGGGVSGNAGARSAATRAGTTRGSAVAGGAHGTPGARRRGGDDADGLADDGGTQGGTVALVPAPTLNTELMSALRSGDPAAVGPLLTNDLQPAALSLLPVLRRALAAGREHGALGAIVSGSGPTCAFLAADAIRARELAVAITGAGVCRAVVQVTGPAPGACIVDARTRE